MLKNFSDEQFETDVKKEDVSVIQFSAAWCGPCKSLKPIMDKISDEKKDINFYYADIEDGGINTGSAWVSEVFHQLLFSKKVLKLIDLLEIQEKQSKGIFRVKYLI